MKLQDINDIMYNIRKKGKNDGITVSDYTILKKIRHSMKTDEAMKKSISKYPRWSNVYDELNKLIDLIYNSGIIYKYSKDNHKYIFNNSYLLPLVLANASYDKIKIRGVNNYMFPCQFHNKPSKNASMGVSDLNNLLNCFGCGINFNIILYLEQYENLRYEQVIELLSMIYLFDDRISSEELNPLVEKYRKTILSEEYMELLLMGKRRLEDKYKDRYDDRTIDDIYSLRFNMIERIRNNEYDPNFEYKENVKIFHL